MILYVLLDDDSEFIAIPLTEAMKMVFIQYWESLLHYSKSLISYFLMNRILSVQ